ncbi:Satratoxin biosynthesis SC1 cluster protein 4 [Colletotrichum aenigma]|uniref:Satratoxin biosynthesis SC1 cluster protein 4 n=1 Tax=Colletotrichum aenigma TaxID=1215731 RepID=UPI0018726706|nr:Satratoxin biosynthesis SC1 cluster protein 4 [Colletotrichum aenigma]KAF5525607.1 Satratoxin biosynthesis SC1 cluster protein 4 [Colletotrichum aenigma]
MGSILDLLGKADNLSDPMPILNERAAVLGMVISFLVVAWICGIFRLYVRFFVAHCLGWDDFFVVLAMLSSLMLSAATCVSTNYGLGQHFLTLGFGGMVAFARSFYVCGGAYAMATALIKLALLFQYMRMFEAGSKSRFVTLVVIYITAAWGLAYSFLAFIPCFPVSAFWNLTTVTKDRWAFGSHDPVIFARTFESHVGMNVALDLIVFLIPLRLFLEQGLRAKSRLGLLGLFTMGVLVNILGIFRLIGITHTQAGTYPTLDPSWYGCVPIVLAAVEVNLATICASLPIFWPVLQMNLGKIFITKEIEITSEVRRFSGDEEMVGELGDLSPQKSLKSLGRDPNPRWSDIYAPSPDRSRAMKVHVEVESGHKHGEKLFVSERSRRVLDDHESQEHIVCSNVPYV